MILLLHPDDMRSYNLNHNLNFWLQMVVKIPLDNAMSVGFHFTSVANFQLHCSHNPICFSSQAYNFRFTVQIVEVMMLFGF